MNEAEQKAADETAAAATAEAEKTTAEAKAKAEAEAASSTVADGEAVVVPAGEAGDKTVSDPATKAKEAEAKRYSELTAGKREAERRATESEARERLALEALQRLGKPVEDAKAKAAEDPKPVMPEFTDPQQYSTDMAEYTEKVASWASRRAVAAAMAEEQSKRAQESQAQTTARVRGEFATRREEAIKRLPDYVEVAENPALPISEALASALTVDPDGTDVAYYLGNNLAEAKRIAALSPGAQLIEYGMLKAKIVAVRASRPISKAPAPTKPVGANASTKKPITDDSVGMDEYAQGRNAAIAASRRPGASR